VHGLAFIYVAAVEGDAVSATVRKGIMIHVSEDEHALLVEAAKRSFNVKLATKARALMLAWAAGAVDTRGGVRGGICGSGSGCTNRPADWWNKIGKFFVCSGCAARLNAHTQGMCSAADGPQTMPEAELVALFESVRAPRPGAGRRPGPHPRHLKAVRELRRVVKLGQEAILDYEAAERDERRERREDGDGQGGDGEYEEAT
jgi:hypothetical protein